MQILTREQADKEHKCYDLASKMIAVAMLEMNRNNDKPGQFIKKYSDSLSIKYLKAHHFIYPK